jgi:dipeptidyl-peptidase-4
MMEQKLSLEDVARYPRPGMIVPRHVEFTPDGRAVAYLFSAEGSLVQGLWRYDIATGERRQVVGEPAGSATPEPARSLDEDLRRERARVREVGVTGFQFARAGTDGPLVLLVPLDGGLHIARGAAPLTRLDASEGALDARLSPDGARVAFVRGDELYVAPTDGSAPPHRLTDGAGDGVTNGLAEYIAQEEMGRAEGYWWSPDGTRLAYVRADSSHIPQYPIVHQGADTLTVEEHRYPFAGARNATVRLGVVAAEGNEDAATATTWMDLGPDDDIYLARVAWRPDGVLTAQIESRGQQHLRLVAFDGRTGAAATLIEERGEPWLNLSDDTRFLTSGEFIWSSERTGFRHLYLYDGDGREARALTEGPWMAPRLVAVDEERRTVYVEGTRDDVRERHLYAVSLDGGSLRRVTSAAGWHGTVISPDFRYFIDTWSAVERAPTVTLRRLPDGAEEAVLHGNEGVNATGLGLLVPELTSFRNRDEVELYAAVYASEATRASDRPAPLIVSVYGGPHTQTVTNRWDLTVDLRAQYLAQQGYVVLKVDNRGSANRGLAFEAALARDMGHVEVDDQVDGVRFLAARPYVDGARIGVYGWSYGGYMTLMALLRAPDVFTVGVAGAPVTSWEGYDTHYTERYMGLPDSNPDGYRTSSVLHHVTALRGRLLLIHGMVDENVHFRHTARLIAALTAAGRPYDAALFPEERHMPRDARGLEYLEQRLSGYFQDHLR